MDLVHQQEINGLKFSLIKKFRQIIFSEKRLKDQFMILIFKFHFDKQNE
jgi:hypothetical protein